MAPVVQVNQRALIEKVLARYSGEFTLFRELLQNSDDAGAPAAEIRFETSSYEYPVRERTISEHVITSVTTSDLSCRKVIKWIVRNKGKVFSEEDWIRLPKIAEGNPDPGKVGAFGVGFYTVFSVTDHPSVCSGGKRMRFFWKEELGHENQLHFSHEPSCGVRTDGDTWTTFEMPLREPCPMPPALDLMRFLASSITFMANLTDVRVYFDKDCIGHVKKSQDSSRAIAIHEGIKQFSPERVMNLISIRCHPVTIEAEIPNMVYACVHAKEPCSTKRTHSVDKLDCQLHKSKMSFSVFTAEVDVKVGKKLSEELSRCTKKRPPSRLKYSLIYFGKDDYSQSFQGSSERDQMACVFQGLYADLNSMRTRIFIGHATAQTTGIGGHMASCFIPTVERESIDLSDMHVARWNQELLHVGGLLCRVIYDLELSNIKDSWEKHPDSREQMHGRFLHVLKFFGFLPSTPSPKVSDLLKVSFYQCTCSPLRLLSSAGVCDSLDVKLHHSVFAKFLKHLPMLPESVACENLVKLLPDSQRILPITNMDVVSYLRQHGLSAEELVSCLRWWLGLKHEDQVATDLPNVITLHSGGSKESPLSSFHYFIDPQGFGVHIPLDSPLPKDVLPIGISKHFVVQELTKIRFLKPFTAVQWIRHVSSGEMMVTPKYNFTKSSDWAELVLLSISIAWMSSPDDSEVRRVAQEVFRKKPCIPTSHGLCPPENSYLPAMKITFSLDIAIVKFNLKPELHFDQRMRGFLSAIGVQIHIPPELLSNQMLDASSLTSFLLQEKDSLDLRALRSTKLFTEENYQINTGEPPKYRADELYPPEDVFRQLQLPIVNWGTKSQWQSDSEEAKLLHDLGLRRYPALETILQLCSSSQLAAANFAFKYFYENFQLHYLDYKAEDCQNLSFIPAEDRSGTRLSSPGDVFIAPKWKQLGLPVIQPEYPSTFFNQLGVKQDPSTSALIDLLKKSPPKEEDGHEWFRILSEYASSFTQPEFTELSSLPMVPTKSRGWLPPVECYLDVASKYSGFYSELFAFVDFGTHGNRFLYDCGSKAGPSIQDVAEVLISDPERFYALAGEQSFLLELQKLASRNKEIPPSTLREMSSRCTLLGLSRKKDNPIKLCKPKEIFIVDDEDYYRLFCDSIFRAPSDETLHDFYKLLGCRRLSSVVKEDWLKDPQKISVQIPRSREIRTLVMEKIPIFLQDFAHVKLRFDWHAHADTFQVMACKKITLINTLATEEEVNLTHKRNVWACTKREDTKRVKLWLSRDAEENMYQLATCLCRMLFGTAKRKDICILESILNAHRDILEERGFQVNVDAPTSSQPLQPIDSDYRRVVTPSPSPSVYSNGNTVSMSLKRTWIPRAVSHVKDKVCRAIPVSRPQRQILTQDYIRDTVSKAINAPESAQGKPVRDMVRSHSNLYDCDLRRPTGSMRQSEVAVKGIPVYVAEDVTNTFEKDKSESLAQFAEIITPIAEVYKLPINRLRIFYDTTEGCIAFNEKGNIYVNLRYFEEWHKEAIENNDRQLPLKSWFLVLAHELAHNITPSHNAEHEFWFSKICEEYFVDFAKLLMSNPSGQ